MANNTKRFDQPPNSPEEGVRAPSKKTFSAAPTAVRPTGSRSATAYQRGPTRQRTIRRNKPPIPVLPRVKASTTSAARKGPKPTMGWGRRSRAYRIEGHHESAQASTKNEASGYLLIKDTRYDI